MAAVPTSRSRRAGAALVRSRLLPRAAERLVRLDAALARRVGVEIGAQPAEQGEVCGGLEVPRGVASFLTFFPPGHFYSPVPDLTGIEA